MYESKYLKVRAALSFMKERSICIIIAAELFDYSNDSLHIIYT